MRDYTYKRLVSWVSDRFWQNIKRSPDNDCWLYQSAFKAGGYTTFRDHYTHRISWVLANKQDWPSGLQSRHLCNTRNCVNPAHIVPGTIRENYEDRVRANTHLKNDRAVETPLGHFKSLRAAAIAHQVAGSTIYRRLRRGTVGYKYL